MFSLLNRILQWVLAVAWLVLVALLWTRARSLALAVLGLGAAFLLLSLLVRRYRPRVAHVDGALKGERAARFLVTQMLRDLTRIQVAYLNQSFGAQEGRSWLKRVLPRSYRSSIGQIHDDLEAARKGQAPPSLRLAMRILAMRDELAPLEQALEDASKKRPDHAVARPATFVITETIDIKDSQSEPLVVSVAGWNPQKPTLLAPVDALTFFAEDEKKRKQVRGQADFDTALSALADHIKPIEERADAVTIYASEPIADDQLPMPLAKVPIGFIVGASELL